MTDDTARTDFDPEHPFDWPAHPAGLLREAAQEVVALLTTSGQEPPPLNDYGLLSTLGYYAGPNARSLVGRETSDRFTMLVKAIDRLRAALASDEPEE